MVQQDQLGIVEEYGTTGEFYSDNLVNEGCIRIYILHGVEPPAFSLFLSTSNSLTESVIGFWHRVFGTFIQIIPASSNGVDTVNFRRMEESTSLHLENQQNTAQRATQTPGTPDGLEPTSGGDLFGAFSSITLHHDGDH